MPLEKFLKVPPKILNLEGEEVNYSLETISPHPHLKKNRPKKVPRISSPKEEKGEWMTEGSSGQLIVDIYEKEDNLIILSTIAGIKPEDIDITVEPDLIIIRGERKKQIPKDSICHIQECFWGKFSRTLVLPSPVKPDKVEADLKNGVLTIILPKAGELSRGVKVEE
ncbi:MAG: Spore protein SP21 [Parcubacteria group bacterium ADurb.Bin159]|jgi:HSP20 family protein|nr:MAG: Spore protein SP21 [Parcubacteria group bacterium ADurb.Bin159]